MTLPREESLELAAELHAAITALHDKADAKRQKVLDYVGVNPLRNENAHRRYDSVFNVKSVLMAIDYCIGINSQEALAANTEQQTPDSVCADAQQTLLSLVDAEAMRSISDDYLEATAPSLDRTITIANSLGLVANVSFAQPQETAPAAE